MATISCGSHMARPSCTLKHLQRSQTRSLSTSRPQSAQAANQGIVMRNMPKQLSMGTRMRNMKRADIPNDLGIIPNTFVRPCGKMPSWFSQPMLRARLEFLYLKQGLTDFGAAYYFKRWSQPRDPVTNRRKKLPLDLRNRYDIACNLHKELNQALAIGDRTVINKIACSGLANQQLSRLDRARLVGKGDPATWTVRYHGLKLPSRLPWSLQLLVPSFFKSIHVLADRQIQLPIGAGMYLRQVFVRVDSTQTLNRNDGSAPVTKRMREYAVLQQATIEDETEDWRVWGTIDPTDPESALDIIQENKSENGSVMDRMKSVFPSMM